MAGTDLRDEVVLFAPQPLETSILLDQGGQKLADERGHRAVALRRSDTGLLVEVIVNRDGDVLHGITISQFHRRVNAQTGCIDVDGV